MKFEKFVIYILGLFTVFNVASCYLENGEGILIELRHKLDKSNPEKFSHRGNVTFLNLNSGMFNIDQKFLTQEEQDYLKILAQKNEFYSLKATITYHTGVQQELFSSLKACSLLHSQLNDVLWISMDNNGFVTAVTLSVSPTDIINCQGSEFSLFSSEDFHTDVLIRHMEQAPVPDTASFIQKIEREAREKGEIRDQRGFFAKYWMYIVPVVLLVLISGATNQEGAK